MFEASCSRRAEKRRDDRKFLGALWYFVFHDITGFPAKSVDIGTAPNAIRRHII